MINIRLYFFLRYKILSLLNKLFNHCSWGIVYLILIWFNFTNFFIIRYIYSILGNYGTLNICRHFDELFVDLDSVFPDWRLALLFFILYLHTIILYIFLHFYSILLIDLPSLIHFLLVFPDFWFLYFFLLLHYFLCLFILVLPLFHHLHHLLAFLLLASCQIDLQSFRNLHFPLNWQSIICL